MRADNVRALTGYSSDHRPLVADLVDVGAPTTPTEPEEPTMSVYRLADSKAQWFARAYPGAAIDPNCGVLHTTEGFDWPGYQDGATAPNYTAKPIIGRKRLDWRAHFPDEMSSRALRNESGGVNTNTANVVQVELVGTCDWSKRDRWGSRKAGVDYIYWPDAPEWALDQLADFIADQHKRHGTKIQGPRDWLNYGPDDRRPGVVPASYGASPVRMNFAQWRQFYGWCGHQHVPENSHGDPGRFPWAKVQRLARIKAGLVDPAPTEPDLSRGKQVDIALAALRTTEAWHKAKKIDNANLRRIRAAIGELEGIPEKER